MSKNGNGSDGRKPDVDALRDDIKQTRAELGETVQALAAKADVKARAKDSVEQTKQRVKAQAAQATDRVREAAAHAGDVVRGTAVQATDRVRGTALQATDKVRESGALDRAQDAGKKVQRNPLPMGAVVVAGVAIVIVLLIVRGRRR
jgi:cobalamin biosynthesis Mg chelatase CobN